MKKVVLAIIAMGIAILGGVKVGSALYQQEKAEKISAISSAIDSWYKVTAGNRHSGYQHNRLTPRTPASLGYDYSEEGELYISDTSMSVTIKAVLNKELNSTSFTYTVSDNTRSISAELAESGGIRSLESTDPSGNKKYWEISPKDEIYPTISVALFALKQKELLKEGSNIKVKICNPIVAGNILITGNVKVAGKQKKKYLNKDVEITVAEVSEAGISYKAYLDNYGRILESDTSTANMNFLIVASSADAMGNLSPAVSQKGRRDPFRKSHVLSGKEGNTPIVRPSSSDSEDWSGEKSLVINQQDVERYMAEIEKLSQDLEKASKNEIGLKATYERFVKIYKGLIDIVKSPIYRDKLTKLRQRAEQLYPGAEYAYNEASQLYKNVVDKFNQNSWKEITPLYNQLKSVSARDALIGTEYKTAVEEVLAKATKLAERVSNREEIMRRNIQVNGIAYYLENKPTEVDAKFSILGSNMSIKETVYLTVSNSYAIVNGKAVREGDLVSGGILVKKINKDQVIFSYKDEELPIYIKRQ